ncbi:conserved Plasmodium protein, unknown function [Plasmodium sp. gorilla clade G2]|uniref:conserved Plasmodium protein, unknown function n=1 Tax=Plasmodium sp. gorilla clade G2 TaxID=880535 RepID=UPI000D2287F9|nr:conserved Plasmodium protein, unknown function [Plasmodium sp. gorilla clade G2]SOV15220.1 conserved Plasmodium protein, unknown function [Plasmodium sp. gorilla clade G2]
MVNQKNGILSKLTGLTYSLFKLNIEDINEEVDENINPLEKAILYGNSGVKCRKILFLKDIMKLLNQINYENFLKYIYPLVVKLSNDDIEIQYEVCNRIGDLCAYLIQNNNHNDGCTDIMKLLFPIVERFIKNNENKNIIETIMKSLLILSTHINWKYRQKFILPFILSLISNEKYKYIGFILLIKLCYIFERNIFCSFLIPSIKWLLKKKDDLENKIYISCYLYNICKMLKEEDDLFHIFLLLKNLCNHQSDTIKIINIFNCTHISLLYSKNIFFYFFVPLYNHFLKNENIYVFYYSLINLFYFICIFEDINLIHPYYIHKMIFFFNNMFSSHTFTLNYLNETAKKKSNYFFLNNNYLNEQNGFNHITHKYQLRALHNSNNMNNNFNNKLSEIKENDIIYNSTYEHDKQNEEPCLIIDEIEDMDNAMKIKGISDDLYDIDVSYSKPEEIIHDSLNECEKLIRTQKDVAECLSVNREKENKNQNFYIMQEQYKSAQMYEPNGDISEHNVDNQKNNIKIIENNEILNGNNYQMCEMKEQSHKYSNQNNQKDDHLNEKLCDQLYIENHKRDSYNMRNNIDIITHLNNINKETEINGQIFNKELKDICNKEEIEKDKLKYNDEYVEGTLKENDANEIINHTFITNSFKNDNENDPLYIEDKSNIIYMNKLNNSKRDNNINKDENLHMEHKSIPYIVNENISNDVLLKNDFHFLNDTFSTIPSIFYNNNLFNDLIINNSHFSISIKQFFEMYSNNYRFKHFVIENKENNDSIDSNDPFDDNNTIKNIENMNNMHDRNNSDYDYNTLYIPMNDKILQDIDNTFINDKNIDIDIIKNCYYNEVELIKKNVAYGKMFVKRKNEDNKSKNKNLSSDNINYNNDETEDIYNVGKIDIDSIKQKFLFDSTNNVIVSHNINAVYITALHLPLLILVFKEYFFRFFSHIFYFICTYPYYIIRMTMAYNFYDILKNFFHSEFLQIDMDKFKKRGNEKRFNKILQKRNNMLYKEKVGKNILSEECVKDTMNSNNNKGRSGTKKGSLDIQINTMFNNDYATYYNMRRIQNMVIADEKLEKDNDDNNMEKSDKDEKENNITEGDLFKENIKVEDNIYSEHVLIDNEKKYENEKNVEDNIYQWSEKNEDKISQTSEKNVEDKISQSSEKNVEDKISQSSEKNVEDKISQSSEQNEEDNISQTSENYITDSNNYEEHIRKLQNHINVNLYESDFFVNEENENFFFYKQFLMKYENMYKRHIQTFKKYYKEDDSPCFFFHFFIYYFLNDTNVLVKKAILKNYDKIITFFPYHIKLILISYLYNVIDYKILNYSLRKRVSKIVFKILKNVNDAKIIREYIFPIYLKLCKDDVATIRTYTASYFYIILQKGCPNLYKFFKGKGKILDIEEYEKDIFVSNEEGFKLKSEDFTGGQEVLLIRKIINIFAMSKYYYDRQIFINICDGIISECPINLFLLYFLNPFINLSDDKIQVVRITWEMCVYSQLKKKGDFSNIANVYNKLEEMYLKYGKTTVSKINPIKYNNPDSTFIVAFDLHHISN